ncbi:glycosyltransferase family 2 protein [Agrobacterium sp. 22-211-1]|uniref:glycosyltransferase family 2 protein n=1 Tax=Agrobacterium tomkonis TaxID=1183410 RepID=UPI001CD93CC9|nr:glycosyltransferase [Agrobacterium tomkonis RTP8]
MSDLTVVLTSCRRPDLLIATVDAFFATNDYPLREFIIIEDSGDESVLDLPARYPDQPVRVILNGVNLGQHRSIDKAYAEVSTSYILHLEDDWTFPVPGTVARGLEILRRDPQVALVQLRTHEDMPEDVRRLSKISNDIGYWKIPPAAHRVWHSFTFNPTLKRFADYQKLPHGYAGFATEAEISLYYKDLGAIMAWLADTHVNHSGFGRSNYGSKSAGGLAGVLKGANRFFSVATLRKWRRSVDRRVAHQRRKHREKQSVAATDKMPES